LLAATVNSGVFSSADTGRTWVQINSGLTENNIKKVYYYNGKKYIISNSGVIYSSSLSPTPWMSINTGLPSGVIPTSLTFNGTELILGTFGNGVFTKNENTGSWTSINMGLSNLNVTSVTTNGFKIFVGTDGSGVFVSDFPIVNWSQTSPTVISHTTLMGLDGNKIQAMAYNAGYVFASYRGGLLASSDNGITWIAGGNQFNLPSYTSVNKITFVTTRVFVTTENNCLYSNSLSELPSLVTQIKEYTNSNLTGTIYPNPTNDELFVDLKDIKEFVTQISLYDYVGKLIQVIKPNKFDDLITISLNNMACGVYTIHIKTDKGVISKKVIKQ
jgi:hypothetical protein